MHACARQILVSVSSVCVGLSHSHSLLSPRNQNYPWIVSEYVSMSICETAISNLSRSFSVCVCVCVCVCEVCINTYVKGNQGVSFEIGGGCTSEYCKGVELLDRLRVKFLKVDGGKWVFMGLCVRDVWRYSDEKVE